MKASKAGIIGVQEALSHQVKDIDLALRSFDYVGVGRDDGKEKGEYSAIFIDTLKFNIIQSQTFWLSETPEKPSVGWDASMERIYTFVLLETKKETQRFWVMNTHFDHIGEIARQKSAINILQKIKQINTIHLPAIIMGDLNFTPDEKPYQILSNSMEDSYQINTENTINNRGSFNGFEKEFEPKRIDYIFTDGFRIKNYYHIYKLMPNGNFPSDHFPISVKMNFIN